MAMKIGVSLPQACPYDPHTDIVEAAKSLEGIGYDSLWVSERLLFPQDQSGPHGLYGIPDLPWAEVYKSVADPLVTLSAAAAATQRVQLGTCVLLAPLYLPVRLATALASLDAVSGGRVLAGLGTGWSIDEYAATSPRPFEQRGAALDEFLDVAGAVWGPDPVAFRNDRYTITPAAVRPKPAGKIPILLPASNRKTFDRVARRAAGWLPLGLSPEQVGTTCKMLREKAAEYGRDPQSLSCIVQIGIENFEEVPATDRRPYTGSMAQIIEDVAALAEVGVEHAFLTIPNATKGLNEFLDTSAEFYTQARVAGV